MMSKMMMSKQFTSCASSRRQNGMTLIEIMMSILILSIGLIGVLASVPFGAMQMGKMVEKDFVTAAARNGQSILRTSGWLLPDDWCLEKANDNWNEYPIAYDASGEWFWNPVIMDPLGFPEFPFGTNTIIPRSIRAGDSSIDFVFPFNNNLRGITPDLNNTIIADDAARLDRLFHSIDDLAYELDANSTNRPILLADTETAGAAFKGEYSWMALLHPSIAGSESICPFPPDRQTVVDVRSDVVVFRGRVPGEEFDYITANVDVVGSGYAGGTMRLRPFYNNFYRCAGDDYNGVVDTDLGLATSEDMLANLQSSVYLLLIGPADGNGFDDGFGSANRQFFRWYKIANSAANSINEDDGSVTDCVDVTLIGEDCPENWVVDPNSAGRVKAIVFKNVRGVLSETSRLTWGN